jgi:hypothetical protein
MTAHFALAALGASAILLQGASAHGSSSSSSPLNVFYIPLDERFTTRDAFLNLARVTPYNVTTPPLDAISSQKTPANLPELDAFVSANLPAADAAVVSLELFVYGGLISSRCSNDTTADVVARAQMLVDYAKTYPHIQFHLGTVVMRIPSYNEDVEEPWYWALYGADLYTYSFYLDKYQRVSHNQSDLQQAEAAAALVPPQILDEFVWRRQRNYNVTVFLLQALANSVKQGTPLFSTVYITQDDNAEYGFNIAEALSLRALVASLGLQDRVLIYPGADEVGLSMLARLSVDAVGGPGPVFQLAFRKPDNASLHLIPNYEGQPMLWTLLDQIQAAGATAAGNWSDVARDAAATNPVWIRPWRCGKNVCDASSLDWPTSESQSLLSSSSFPSPLLLVNNFGLDEYPQIEAPDQTLSGRSPADYAAFTPLMCGQQASRSSVVSVADNRYSNGADLVVLQYLYQRAADGTCAAPSPTNNAGGLGLDRAAYAGWNTDGNTVGTSVSNLVLLYYFSDFGPQGAERRASVEARIRARAAERRRAGGSARAVSGAGSARPSDPSPSCTASCANTYFNALRFVEDGGWQANLRQQLAAYVGQVDGESVYTLGDDLPFYERYAFKVLGSRLQDAAAAFNLSWTMQEVYYPWNRTFEVGLVAQ